jgi:hypothetical protein
MTYQLRIARGPRLAVAEVTALGLSEDAATLLREIESETRKHGDRRLLINLLDVVGTFGKAEHAQMGQLLVRHLSHLEKVASLVPEEKITRVSEQTARAQGMELRVFTVLGEAIAWLME